MLSPLDPRWQKNGKGAFPPRFAGQDLEVDPVLVWISSSLLQSQHATRETRRHGAIAGNRHHEPILSPEIAVLNSASQTLAAPH